MSDLEKLQLSRFAFPIDSEGHKLLYSSRLNNFYEVSDALFGLPNLQFS